MKNMNKLTMGLLAGVAALWVQGAAAEIPTASSRLAS